MKIWMLKLEDKKNGEVYLHCFQNYDAAVKHLNQAAGIIVGENEWLDHSSDKPEFAGVKEEYEFYGDFVQEEDSFYLVDVAQITLEEHTVFTG